MTTPDEDPSARKGTGRKKDLTILFIVAISLVCILGVAMAIDSHSDDSTAYSQERWDVSRNGDGSIIAFIQNGDTLALMGAGEMKDYTQNDLPPWMPYKGQIKKVVFYPTIVNVGNYAFYGMGTLEEVTLGNLTETIGSHSFYNCMKLSSVHVLNGTAFPNVTSQIGDSAFEGCYVLNQVSIITQDFRYIGANAFKNCNAMTSFELKVVSSKGQDITIGHGAFERCRSLTSVELSDNVTYIMSNAFKDCTSLTTFKLPAKVYEIHEDTFKGCTNLTTLDGQGSHVKIIDPEAFVDCTNLTTANFGPYVRDIGKYAFQNCTSLKSTDLFEHELCTIGESAFINCRSLEKLRLDVTNSIGPLAFQGCSFKEIDPTKCRGAIADDAFAGCTFTYDGKAVSPSSSQFKQYLYKSGAEQGSYVALIVVKVGDNMTSTLDVTTGLLTFYGTGATYDYDRDGPWPTYRDRIKNVMFNCDGEISLGSFILYSMTNLETVEFSTNCTVKNVGTSAFLYCTSLKSIDLTGTILIGESAFHGCTSLESVKIVKGSTALDIGRNAFFECTSLSSFEFASFVWSIGEMAFAKSGLTSAEMVYGTSIIAENAFYGCGSLKKVTIPSSVDSIGKGAFKDCNALETVWVMSSQEQWQKIVAASNDIFGSTKFYLNGSTEISYNDYTKFPGYRYGLQESKLVREDNKSVNVTVIGDGNVIGDGRFYPGQTVTLIAEEVEGSVFYCWKVNGTAVSFSSEYSFVMGDTDVSITAVFGHHAVVYIELNGAYFSELRDGWKYDRSNDRLYNTFLDCMVPLDVEDTFTMTIYREGYDYYGMNLPEQTYITNGMTITLDWNPLSADVVFHCNDGTMTEKTQTLSYDDAPFHLDANTFTRPGYVFDHWNTKVDGTGVSYADGAEIQFPLDCKDIELYAIWKPVGYYVTFNGNGSTSGSMDTIGATVGKSFQLPANKFAKTGCTFVGWAITADGQVCYVDMQTVMDLTQTKDYTVTLYAKWVSSDQVTVVYDLNGGNGTFPSSTVDMGATYTVVSGEPTRTGYVFGGWNDGTAIRHSGDQITVNSGVVLKAVWTPIHYTVEFDGNGSTSGTMSSMDMTYDQYQNIASNEFKRTGYTFLGWGENTTDVKYSNGEPIINLSSTASDTVTLHAIWKANDYTVEFIANGGDGSMAPQPMVYAEAKVLEHCIFVKDGYVFKGWATSAGGSAVYTDGQSVSNLTSDPNGNVKLYAVWEKISYKIVFDANTGSGTMAGQVFHFGDYKALTTNGYSKSGSKFIGWCTKADGSGQTFYDGQVVGELTSVDGSTITLYAMWSDNTYTITFDNDGGSGGPTSINGIRNATCTIPNEVPTKEGHSFVGWTYDGKLYPAGAVIQLNGHMTLKAKWEAKTYCVTFDINDGTGATVKQYIKYGEPTSLQYNDFERTGYFFYKWNTEPDGSGTSYDNGQVVDITGSVTLYAQWGIQSCLIITVYDDTDSIAFYTLYGNVINRADIDRSIEGKVLLGWYCNGELYDFQTVLTGDVTLVARWGDVTDGKVVVNNVVSNEVEVDLSTNASVKEITVNFPDTSLTLDLQGQEIRPQIYISMYETSTPGRYSIETIWLADSLPFTGKITVTIPYESVDGKVPVVYYYAENGEKIRMDSTVNADGTITFVTYHNSEYGVEYVNGPASNGFLLMLALVAVIAAILLSMTLVPRKN